MISVLIPVKNEPYIYTLVKKIHKVLKMKHEIIVIDKSDFLPEISGAKVIRQRSDGLGNAVLEGLEYAKGDIIVVMDGDGSHRPEDIPKLIDALKQADVVIGSRFISGGKTKDFNHRKLISLIFRKFASLILDLRIEDAMSGFAVFRKEVVQNLKLKPLGYKIIMEIVFKSKDYRICEIPIIFEGRKCGKSKTSILEVFRILIYIFELRLGIR
jgi:dolichol-phosphate mannosyltransferase